MEKRREFRKTYKKNQMTITLIITTIMISLFCVGLRIISSKGMIFYFIRKPYEWLDKHIDNLKEHKTGDVEHRENIKKELAEAIESSVLGSGRKGGDEEYQRIEKILRDMDVIIFKTSMSLLRAKIAKCILKPIIGCTTCMASVWTVVWYTFVNGYGGDTTDFVIVLVMMGAAFLNTVFYSLYELIENKKKCNC